MPRPYVYRIEKLDTGEFYIGVRYSIHMKEAKHDLGFEYFSSGKLEAEFRRDPSNFKKEILGEYDVVAQASHAEQQFIRNEIGNPK